MRVALALMLFAGCTGTEPAELSTAGSLVALKRPTRHDWGAVSATVNGHDLGAPDLFVGDNVDGRYDEPSYARFAFSSDMLAPGTATEVIVIEDGDRFRMTLPDLATPRTLVLPALDAGPLDAHAPFDVASNVATDEFHVGSVSLFSDPWTECRSAYPLEGPGPLHVDLLASWECPTMPAAGTTATFTMDLDFSTMTGQLGDCEGLDLTCVPPGVGLDSFRRQATIQLAF